MKVFVVIRHGHEAVEVLGIVENHTQRGMYIECQADAGELVTIEAAGSRRLALA